MLSAGVNLAWTRWPAKHAAEGQQDGILWASHVAYSSRIRCNVNSNKQNRKWGRMGRRTAGLNFFTCPNCRALYQIVKAKAGPETVFQEAPCCVCGEAIVGREGTLCLNTICCERRRALDHGGAQVKKPQPDRMAGAKFADSHIRERFGAYSRMPIDVECPGTGQMNSR
jgi:hypothetical protein